jgi:hypothetical protein
MGLGSRSGDRGRARHTRLAGAPLPETPVDRTTARGRRSAARGVPNFLRAADQFRLDIDLIFVDTTTVYFEIDAADEAAEEWASTAPLR